MLLILNPRHDIHAKLCNHAMFLVRFNQSDNEVQGFISGFSCIHDYYSNQRGTLLRVENESGPNKDQS